MKLKVFNSYILKCFWAGMLIISYVKAFKESRLNKFSLKQEEL